MKMGLEIRLEQMAKTVVKLLCLILVLTGITVDVACIHRTKVYMNFGWDFMRAATKAADEVGTDISEAWHWMSRKLGFGPAWTESWAIPNANINWNSLGKRE